jgi:hypothetical protein
MGSMDKESSIKLLDAYFDAGVSRLFSLSPDMKFILSNKEILSTPLTISEIPAL